MVRMIRSFASDRTATPTAVGRDIRWISGSHPYAVAVAVAAVAVATVNAGVRRRRMGELETTEA
jgi:hypothetical protein